MKSLVSYCTATESAVVQVLVKNLRTVAINPPPFIINQPLQPWAKLFLIRNLRCGAGGQCCPDYCDPKPSTNPETCWRLANLGEQALNIADELAGEHFDEEFDEEGQNNQADEIPGAPDSVIQAPEEERDVNWYRKEVPSMTFQSRPGLCIQSNRSFILLCASWGCSLLTGF